MTFLDCADVLTPDGWAGPSRLVLADGRIESLQALPAAPNHLRVVPGFVDLQVNGIDDVDIATADGADWDRLDHLLLAQGVTTWCPTMVTMPLDRYERPLARVAAAMQRPTAARPHIAGVHLEGPFLGRSPGAHPPALIVPVDLDWLAALPPHVALVTLAAEQDQAVEATRLLAGRGVLVSIGHSQCSEGEFDGCVAAGARLTTHLFNGMSGVHHRSPGTAVWAVTNPGVSASLIADGVHVHPRVLALGAAALGPERTVLVTDAVAWRAGNVGVIGMEMRDGAPRLPDGTLAGSAVTMDASIRQLVSAGVPLAHAVRAASTNPARLLGLQDRGTVEVGRRADLVALDPELQVAQVWVGGVATR